MRLRHVLVLLPLILAPVLPAGFAHSGQTVETGEGIAYAVPDGWSVERFSGYDGSASFIHAKSGATMQVHRYGLLGKRDPYSNKEPLAGGRTLEWQYTTAGLDNWQFLVARVTLAEAHVEMSALAKDQKGRVPQEMGLAAMRQIAQTAKVIGPRGCVGSDCKEKNKGVIKDSK